MKTSEALQKVGNGGKYQRLLLIYMCIFWVNVAYMLLGPSYIYMNPTFRCEGEDKILDEVKACPIIEQFPDKCQLVDNHTITATVGLYCKKQFQRNLIQSSMYIGSISGLIIMNLISDKYGRKFSFMISLIICIFGAACVTIGGFTKFIAFLVIGQILNGFGGYSCMTISYIMMSDLMGDKLRQKGIIIVNAAWALGEVSFFLLYNYLNQWYTFLIAFLLIPLVLQLVVGYFFLLESPVYLNEYSREKCVVSLNKIAEWNNTQPLQADDIEINPKINDDVSAFEVFKHWPYLKCIILISLFEITTNMFYYGTQYSMEHIGSNFGVNMLIIGCLEFIAYFSSSFFVDKLKRKRSMMLLNLIGGGLCALFVFKAIRDSSTMQIIFVPFSRFVLTYCQGLLALFMNESFPDRVKSSGSGSIEALSNLGNLVTPFVVTLTSDAGLDPVFVVSVILMLGIIPLFFTKETLHHIATEKDIISQEEGLKESLITGGGGSSINQ